ncbi:MAG: glycosyltransferase family 87 protein [Pseudomonadota bacterium]
MRNFLRDANWLDEARIRRVSLLLLGIAILTTIWIIASSSGSLDVFGRPLGTDFSNVWSAGYMANEGRAGEAYDPILQHDAQRLIFGDPDVPFYGWHYPPFFLLAAALLAFLPYTLGWLAWMAVTLPAYVAVMGRLLQGRTALFAALAFPPVAINFLHGQNGFLTAALIGGAMVCLNPRPWMAGVLIGLLAYKPQYGLLIPLVLLVGGHYRTFFSASLTVLTLCAISTLVFGMEIWLAFYESRHFTQHHILEAGSTGWYRIQSVFAATRMWGVSIPVAYAIQILLALSVVAGTVWVWASKTDFIWKASTLISGSLLLTPYILDYDLVAMAPAIALVAGYGLKHGFLPYEKASLAFVWAAPFFARPAAEYLLIPLGFLSMMGLFLIVMRRCNVAIRQREADPGLLATA